MRLKWESEQNELKKSLVEEDAFDWVLDTKNPDNTTLKLVNSNKISTFIDR